MWSNERFLKKIGLVKSMTSKGLEDHRRLLKKLMAELSSFFILASAQLRGVTQQLIANCINQKPQVGEMRLHSQSVNFSCVSCLTVCVHPLTFFRLIQACPHTDTRVLKPHAHLRRLVCINEQIPTVDSSLCSRQSI